MVFSLDYRAHSEIGLVRKNNQDSGFCSPRMLMVADGMGGAAAGDLASSLAVHRMRRSDSHRTLDEAHVVLAGALSKANDDIADTVEADPALDGMGTTVTAALFTGTELGMVHIGDSRAYLFRGGQLHRITHDHSWVQSLVDEGKITEAEAAVHPHRSLLLKVLNGQPDPQPDLETVELALDDRLLFCSDGLCGFVDEAEIERLLALDLDEALEQLVAAAHRGGGADNITVVLADVLAHDEALETREPMTVGAASEKPDSILEDHTLSGAEGIVLATAEPEAATERVIDPDSSELDEETLRYAPRTRSIRSVLVSILLVLALVAAIAGGLWGGWRWSRTQYFIGAQDENVAIFRGVPGSVFGHPLSEVVERRSTKVADLPKYYRSQVEQTIDVKDEVAARTSVDELEVKARQCIALRESRATVPAPTAPTSSASPTATAPASAAPASVAPSSSVSASSSVTPSPSASSGQVVTPSTLDQEC